MSAARKRNSLSTQLKTSAWFMVFGVALLATPAHAISFDFAFENINGNVPGTVTGRILGLQDNLANQAATSVLIDSFPAGLPGVLNSGADAVAWESVPFNLFSVTAGQIVAARFGAQDNSLGAAEFDTLVINQGFATNIGHFTNALTLNNGRNVTGNDDGFGAATFTPAVPEPSTVVLMGLGLVGLGYAGRRKLVS